LLNRKASRPFRATPFDAIAKPESFSLLNLNPPYDSAIGLVANNRMERLFLITPILAGNGWRAGDGHSLRAVMDCAGLLSSHFTALNVFRMTDEESRGFRQIAVFGVRANVRGSAIEANKRLLQRIGLYGQLSGVARVGGPMPASHIECHPQTKRLSATVSPTTYSKTCCPNSGAWKQVMRFSAPHE